MPDAHPCRISDHCGGGQFRQARKRTNSQVSHVAAGRVCRLQVRYSKEASAFCFLYLVGHSHPEANSMPVYVTGNYVAILIRLFVPVGLSHCFFVAVGICRTMTI
jgi:hypothetical protein